VLLLAEFAQAIAMPPGESLTASARADAFVTALASSFAWLLWRGHLSSVRDQVSTFVTKTQTPALCFGVGYEGFPLTAQGGVAILAGL
jgi:hypothetical protein